MSVTRAARLYEVTEYETARPRVLVVWTDEWDFEAFDAVCRLLDQQEYRVLNVHDEMPSDEIDLAFNLVTLAAATHIALPSTWWTSATAHQLVQVAGWLGRGFIDHEGHLIETVSLRSA